MESSLKSNCVKCDAEAQHFHNIYFIKKKNVEITKQTNVHVNHTTGSYDKVEVKGYVQYDKDSLSPAEMGFCSKCYKKRKRNSWIFFICSIFFGAVLIIPYSTASNKVQGAIIFGLLACFLAFILSLRILINVFTSYASWNPKKVGKAFRKSNVIAGVNDKDDDNNKMKKMIHNLQSTRLISPSELRRLKRRKFRVNFSYDD